MDHEESLIVCEKYIKKQFSSINNDKYRKGLHFNLT